MNFTCHTTYDQKARTAMARAIRKTVRADRSGNVRCYVWIIIRLLMVSLLKIEKKFSAMALSYGFPFLDMDGVMPYA